MNLNNRHLTANDFHVHHTLQCFLINNILTILGLKVKGIHAVKHGSVQGGNINHRKALC